MAQSKAQEAGPRRSEDRWVRGEYTRHELLQALLDEGMAGEVSHDRQNVSRKIHRLVSGDPDATFGLSGMTRYTFEEVLLLVDRAIGFDPGPEAWHVPTVIEPGTVLDALEAMGDRLALAAERGEEVLIATGHPVGMSLLYLEIARELSFCGVKLLRPLEGLTWREGGAHRQIRYLQGVGVLTDRASSIHTHSPGPMERMLSEARPDLVLADHGFAGAAIEAGIETVCVTDVNDPALVVAREEGWTKVVVVMDDNVQPEAYWPCYQAILGRFPARGSA
jgi:hypothetical protein